MPSFKQDLEKVDNSLLNRDNCTIPENTGFGLLSTCARVLDIKTLAGREFLRIAMANALLMDRKQQDYGPHNIRKGGVFGCCLRSSDKFERIFNLYNKRKGRAVNESIQDSFRDVSNYMIIALMLELERWPNE